MKRTWGSGISRQPLSDRALGVARYASAAFPPSSGRSSVSPVIRLALIIFVWPYIGSSALDVTIHTEGIAALAYKLWQERGCPIGSDQEDWFRAENELKNRKAMAAGAS